MVDADQQVWLKVYVTAVPESGKANEALFRLVSKTWKIPSSQIEIVKGHTAQWKVLKIHGLKDLQLRLLS